MFKNCHAQKSLTRFMFTSPIKNADCRHICSDVSPFLRFLSASAHARRSSPCKAKLVQCHHLINRCKCRCTHIHTQRKCNLNLDCILQEGKGFTELGKNSHTSNETLKKESLILSNNTNHKCKTYFITFGYVTGLYNMFT